MGMWIFQINLRSAYGLHVPHFIVSVSCSVGLVLVWSWSWLGLALPWSWSWLGLALPWSRSWLGLDPSKSWSCLGLDTLWSWSWLGLGLGGLDYNTGGSWSFELPSDSLRTLRIWRGSAKRSGPKSLPRSVQTCWRTTTNIWPLCFPTKVCPPSIKSYCSMDQILIFCENMIINT